MRYALGHMRRSPKRHPLAVLRQILELGQKEMAELAGCSVPTIQSIELGRLKLSEKLAAKISVETGVDLTWLMEGNPDVSPKCQNGCPYTRHEYEQLRAIIEQEKKYGGQLGDAHTASSIIHESVYNISILMSDAFYKKNIPLVAYRIHAAIKEILDDINPSNKIINKYKHNLSLLLDGDYNDNTWPDASDLIDAMNMLIQENIDGPFEIKARSGKHIRCASRAEYYKLLDESRKLPKDNIDYVDPKAKQPFSPEAYDIIKSKGKLGEWEPKYRIKRTMISGPVNGPQTITKV